MFIMFLSNRFSTEWICDFQLTVKNKEITSSRHMDTDITHKREEKQNTKEMASRNRT
jgi:hypothetical protein